MRKSGVLLLAAGLGVFLAVPVAQAASWRSIGPEGGFVPALAFAPSDPRVAYAGTLGGVFRSGDGGSSWTAASNGLSYVESLAVDPHDPAVVYAAAGGLFKTTSGGASWRLLPLSAGPFGPFASMVRIDPTRPRILYAVTLYGLFRSADGGAHWTERDAGLPAGPAVQVSALDLDPDRSGTLYAGVIDTSSPLLLPVIYKTTNGGGSWTALMGLRASRVYALARQRSTDTLYAATPEGLFATRDGGATWTLLNATSFVDQLAIAPSGTLYGGNGSGVVSSIDGGRTWNLPEPSSPVLPPSGILSLALNPRGDRLLAGSRGPGIYSLAAGVGWTQVNRSLRAAYVTALAVSSTNPPLLFAATFGGGVFVSGNGGADFSARNAGLPRINSGEIDVVGLAVSPRAPRSLGVGSLFGNVAQTSDAGRHWTSEASLCLSADTLALDPPATIFVASSAAIAGNSCPAPDSCTAKVSRDGGSSFTCLAGPQAVSAFLVDPLQPAVVYAAGGDAIWKSTDLGGHFARVAGDLGMIVTSLVASPAAHQTLYAGGANGVLKSTDGGVSWSPANAAGFPGAVAALVVDPENASLLYALSSGSVSASRDGGANWSSLGDGFPGTYPTAFALDSVRHALYAGTQGGAWALTLP
jgi:photosystem II stability/assembly factor-like uncharacterized protein